MTINSGVTVTVEPDAVVKLSSTLTANGTLDVNGTAADPAIFTSSSDSAPAQWYGVTLNTSASSLDHAEIRYSRTGLTLGASAGPAVTNSTIKNNAWQGVLTNLGSTATITDNSIHDNGMQGIAISAGSPEVAQNTVADNTLQGISYTASGSNTGNVKIHDNTVDDNGSDGIQVSLGNSSVAGQTLEGNTATDNAGKAIYYYSQSSGSLPPDIDETGTLSGNGSDAIWLAGHLNQTTTWEDRGFPLVLIPSGVTVGAGKRLTLSPGMVFKGGYYGGTYQGKIYVEGELDARGTASEPIALTSIYDDSIGGDTNYDGSATTPRPDDWSGIQMALGSTYSTFDHLEVGYAEHGIATNSNTAAVTNSSLHDNRYNGVQLLGGNTTVTDNTSDDNGMSGIAFTGGGNPEIARNTVTDNYVTGSLSAGGGINFEIPNSNSSQVNVHDNVVARNGSLAGIRVWQNSSATTTGVSLGGNTIEDNTGRALVYQTSGSIPTDIDSGPAPSGNGLNAIFVSGKVETSTTWQGFAGAPYVITGGYDLTVSAAKTLTLAPGTVVKGEGTTSDLVVTGTLSAEGTAADPITFTSFKDDTAGGDVNGDSPEQSPAAANWGGISFASGSPNSGTGSLDHTRVSYGGSSLAALKVTCTCSTPPQIRNSKVTDNTYGIYVSGNPPSGAQSIAARTDFARNTSAAIDKSGTSTAPFPYNTFNSESGPYPGGSGDAVGSKIDYSPLGALPRTACLGDECELGGDPISLPTGALTYTHTDIRLTNKSDAPLAFARSYASSDPTSAGMGPGWSHTGLLKASEFSSGDVVVRRANGRQDLFSKVGSAYTPPSSVHDTLTKLGSGAFQLKALDRTTYDFRLDGRIDAITDDHGLVTDYAYNSSGRLTSITDPSAQTLTFTYDSSNRITKVTDSAAREVSYTYTAAGDLDTVTDALGGITDYGYDAQHRLTTIKDPRGVTFLTNTYDGQGRVSEQRDALNNLWTLDYGSGQTTLTEPEGGEITYAFDGQLRLASQTDQLGHATSYGYDAAGNIDQITRPGGAVTSLDYDAAGNLVLATDPEGGERTYTYDSANRLTSFTDERSKTWTYAWNSSNDLTEIEDPATETTEFTYNSAGQPLTVTDPNGHATSYGYGAHGVLGSVTDPLSHQTSFGYDAYNQLTSVTRPGLAAESYTRSKLGDLLTQTTPEGHTTSFGHDQNGALTSITDPALNEWQIERDAMERPITYTDPLLNETTIAHDGNLNPISTTDRNSHTTTYAYDPANQLTEVDAPATGAWQFGYDARGNRDQVIDPRSNVTAYTYDLADRLIEAAEPETTTSSYAYDPAGHLASLTDPNEHTTDFAYDDLGRLAAINQPLSKTTSFAYDPAGNLTGRTTAEDALTLAYDNADRLTSISDGTSTLRGYGYDNANRLTAATDAQAKTLEFGYDDDGNLVSVDDDRGQTVARSFDSRGNLSSQTDGRGTIGYVYDELNRMTQLTDPQSDVIGFDYDPAGNLTETTLPNGVVTTNSYDNADRLLETSSVNGATVLQSFDYVYDPAGNRTSMTDRNNDTTTYAYDDLSRLIEFDPPASPAVSYGYDDAGNRTSAGGTTFTFNALNQLVDDSAVNDYSYDDGGRLTGIDDGTNSVSYDWDALDQLVGVDDGASPVSYTYDALGRRSERTVGATTQTAHYGDLGDAAILDTDASGVAQSWIQGPAGSARTAAAPMSLVEQETSAGVAFPLTDAHGDVTTVADDVGVAGSRQQYDPWGDQLAGPVLDMGWLGAYERRTDAGIGLLQMGGRQYLPEQSRFLTEDPVLALLGRGQTAARYEYGAQNPINWYDLDGRMLSSAGGGYWDPGHVGKPPKPDGLRGDDMMPCAVTGTVVLVPRATGCDNGADALDSGRVRCSAGPFGGQVGGNTTLPHESTTGFDVGLPVPIPGNTPLTCFGTVSTGEENGGGVGATACAGFCFGLSTDTGFSFGTGLGVDVDLSALEDALGL